MFLRRQLQSVLLDASQFFPVLLLTAVLKMIAGFFAGPV